jgi:hypothetical protein
MASMVKKEAFSAKSIGLMLESTVKYFRLIRLTKPITLESILASDGDLLCRHTRAYFQLGHHLDSGETNSKCHSGSLSGVLHLVNAGESIVIINLHPGS